MSSSSSPFTLNPLFTVKDPLKEKLPPKYPELSPKIYEDESELTNKTSPPNIFELIYYNQNDYKSLPLRGWIKPCVKCHSRTGQTIIYAHPNVSRYQYVRLYICSECKKRYKTNLQTKCKPFVKHYIKKYQYFIP